MTPYKRKDSPFFYIHIRPEGYPHEIGPLSSGLKSKRKARAVEATLRDLAARGIHGPLDRVRAGEVSVTDVHAAARAGTLPSLMKNPESRKLETEATAFIQHNPKNYRAAMRRLIRFAGDDASVEWLREPENLRALVAEMREEGLSAGTERRNMSGVSMLIRTLFGDAERDRIFERVRLRPEGRSRTRWLTAAEIRKLREACPPDWWTLFGTLLATGIRLGEALALRVRDIDFDDGQLRVVEGKTAASRRTVPLQGEATGLLRGWIAGQGLQGTDRLFQGVSGNMAWHAWDAVRESVGLQEVRIHDLRHTYAVHCAKAGMPLPELKARLGHETIRVTMRYAIYSPAGSSSHYEAALETMGIAGESQRSTATDATTRPTLKPVADRKPEDTGTYGDGGAS